ncbi:MAG: ATP synthase subunit I [Desulfobacterales bacterium]|nr:ATP synthase subunit I [Desulfobacterales bacterium]
MEAVKQIQKKIIQRALWISIIVGLVFILAGHKPVGKGLILGTLFSVLNFILMAKSIAMKFGRSKRQIFSISLGSIIFRYLLLAIPLIAAVKFEQFNLVAAVVGVFMIQLVILADHLLTQIPTLRGKQV